jgi:hypothetical protein
MNFGAQSRGFGTRCLRFKNGVATVTCKARFRPAGLAFTGRASNPLDRYKRFQIIHPPFLDLSWRKRSFMGQPFLPYGATAIAEISICTSRGSRVTSTVALAGGAFLKNMAYMPFIFSKLFRSLKQSL